MANAKAGRLGWIRNLCEVGRPLLSLVDAESELLARLKAIDDEKRSINSKLHLHRRDAIKKIGEYYSAEEIRAAKEGHQT